MEFNQPTSLSASEGGAPVLLDDATVPGKIVHSNGVSSGSIDVLMDLRVRNENGASQSFWWAIQGGSVPVPTSRAEMNQEDVGGLLVMERPRVIVLEPGYALHVSADVQGRPLQLLGAVDKYQTGGVFGYGGLLQQSDVSVGNITAGTWVTVPFNEGSVSAPVNVTQDIGNNRLQLNKAGLWFATIYGVIVCTKTSSDRVLYTRVYNETLSAPYSPNPWPLNIENQNNNAHWSYSVLVEVPEALVGNYFRLELGGSVDAVNGITLQKAGANFVLIDTTA